MSKKESSEGILGLIILGGIGFGLYFLYVWFVDVAWPILLTLLPFLVGAVVVYYSVKYIRTNNKKEREKYERMVLLDISSVKILEEYIKYRKPALSDFNALFLSKLQNTSNMEIP
ncbi:hypothetical protein OAM64_02110, partial [Candidatus Thioglobus sp.]|nr:hypothetical protein [Candidatus Thioglobus sp.]